MQFYHVLLSISHIARLHLRGLCSSESVGVKVGGENPNFLAGPDGEERVEIK